MAHTISVGELVGMVLRGGDIDNRFGAAGRMQEGQEAHRIIQGDYEAGWEKEVVLKYLHTPMDLVLQGRADGVMHRRGIHEIKSTRRKLEEWDTEGEATHWAQAYCYGYMLALEEKLESVNFMLTYVNLPMETRRDFHNEKTFEWLKAYVEALLDRYKVWHDFKTQWLSRRTESLAALGFPYGDYRPGQRKLAASVYSAIRDGFNMMAEAPTGVGKTVSTLFPALKAMGEGHVDRIFYLTAKTVARTVAEESLIKIREGGAVVKSVTLTAKDKICFTGEKKCNPEDCAYAKGHFDRINDCLMEALTSADQMDRVTVEAFAQKHQVCPHEFALDLSLFSDVIVCDYNYAFDPLAKLQRFFVEVSERYVFLVDEAHNLPGRGREMFSAELSRDEVMALRRAYPKNSAPYKALGKVNSQLLALQKQLKADETPYRTGALIDGKFLSAVAKAFDTCGTYALDHEDFELASEDSERLLKCYRFNFISDYYSEGHLWVETEENGGTCKMHCIDPSAPLAQAYQNAAATVLFSATMAPYAYYEEVLGVKDCRKLVLDSPFKAENRQMILGAGVDTRLESRERHYDRIVTYLLALVESKQANYLVFCPSYEFLRQIEQRLAIQLKDGEILCQSPGMTEADKAAFLDRFEAEGGRTAVGLAVLGGSFSEGIDLVGGRLEGVALIGMGTPYMSPENELIRSFYDARGSSGYTYAYVYPAINKIVQAVGRLIRTETDRGVVLFLDDRYLYSRYKALLPSTWRIKKLSEPEAVYESHLAFWNSMTKEG